MLKGDGSMKRVIALIAAIALLISGVVMSVFNVFQKDQLDYNRSEKAILNDFKNGIIGKITLERCNDDGWF